MYVYVVPCLDFLFARACSIERSPDMGLLLCCLINRGLGCPPLVKLALLSDRRSDADSDRALLVDNWKEGTNRASGHGRYSQLPQARFL